MQVARGSTFAFSVAGFAVGTALVTGFVALAYATPAVARAAGAASPFVPVVLLGAALVGLAVTFRGRARPPAPPAEPTEGARRRDAVLAGLAIPAATFAFVLALFDAWSSLQSNGSFTGGVVPVSDAGAYFAGAERLLMEGALDGWNSRRPLNAAFLVTRIALADGDFRDALLLQAALLGTTTALAARALARDFGRTAGLLFFAGLYIFGGIFVATTMSESLGLSLGALAFAILWHAMRTRRLAPLAVGFAVCAMALNARSGAFLVLPCLVVWAATSQAAPRSAERVDLFAGFAALLGTAAGFGVNGAVANLYAGASGGTHSNFSYTLYGLAKGGVGWERAIADFPELRGMGDAEAGSFVYARALDTMQAHPADFALGLVRNVDCFVSSMSEKLSLGLLGGHPFASWAFAIVWGGAALYLVLRTVRNHGGDRGLGMIAAATAGIALSVPVIYMDGRERVFAASVPFVLAGAAIAITSLATRTRAVPRSSFEHAAWLRPVANFAGVLALVAVAGPRISHDLFAPKPPASAPRPLCQPGSGLFTLTGRTGLPHVDITDATAFKAGIARDVNLGTSPFAGDLAMLRAGDTFTSVFDLTTHRVRHIVLPTASFVGLTSTVTVCGDAGPNGEGAVVRLGGE